MKNKVTFDEKLEFYKNFNNVEFQKKFNDVSDMVAKIGVHSTMISIIISVICGVFNPWLFLLLAPSLCIPTVCLKIYNHVQNKAIKSLNENLTLKDVEFMKKSGEWQLFEKELQYQERQKMKQEKQKNEKNCLKQNHKQASKKQQNKQKKYVIDENLFITYHLLSDFAAYLNCSLKEFSSLPTLTNDSYYVVLTKNEIDYEFEVSNKGFVGIYESDGINFTEHWFEFLESKKQINSIN